MKYFLLLFVLFAFYQCKTANSGQPINPDVQSIIQAKEAEMGYPFNQVYNEDQTYLILMPAKSKNQHTYGDEINNLIVVRLKDNEIIFDEKVRGGTIQWINEGEVEIFYPSGIPGSEKSAIFNVSTGKKTSKNIK